MLIDQLSAVRQKAVDRSQRKDLIQLVLMKYFGEGINSKAVSVCGASRSKSFGLKVLAEQGPVHCGLDIVQIN